MFLYFNTNLGEDKNSSSSFTSDYFNNIFRLGNRRFRILNKNTLHIFCITCKFINEQDKSLKCSEKDKQSQLKNKVEKQS